MSFSFTTFNGQAAEALIPTKFDLTGYTLTFSTSGAPDYSGSTNRGTVTYSNGIIKVDLTATDVTNASTCYFRIQATNGTNTFWVTNGQITYSASRQAPNAGVDLDASNYLKDYATTPVVLGSNVLVLGTNDIIPGGTPPGTLIVRTSATG